jgi:hypothetical protein
MGGSHNIKYATIRYMGPRKYFMYCADGVNVLNRTPYVLGRYGLHFHHNDDHVRNSVVEGVVVRDTDSHAYVPHMSHGIIFQTTSAITRRTARSGGISPGLSTDS